MTYEQLERCYKTVLAQRDDVELEVMGLSHKLDSALEAIKELQQELGLVKISLDHKVTLLNSCEIALEQEQFPQK